ncbi:MAG: hypothetical protein AAB692_05920 [Patescibacteria group bacterium]
MKLYYSQDYASSGDPFDTTQKARHVCASLNKDPVADLELASPEPVTVEQLSQIHELGYIDAIRTGSPLVLAESHGLEWDAGLWKAVCASTGGMIAAALQAITDGVSGTLSSGLHHARSGAGAGFCTFNGLALAAMMAHRKTGGRVLILDLDAHCGGGTIEIIGRMPWAHCLDVSVNAFDAYRPSGEHTLDLVSDPAAYLKTVERRLAGAGEDYALCLYNAGMDPYERCHIGGLRGITQDVLRAREHAVFAWCRAAGIPVAFTLAGGYSGPTVSMADLVSLHRLTIDAATRH